MATILALFKDTALYLLETLRHNAAVLIAGILIASALQVYLDTERMKRWLLNRPALSIPATVAFGAFTPFCACGTMALVLGMLASALPWGAIMAFLTSSPLMSPDEFVVISGVLGVRFASALTAASLVIGLGSGYLANLLQKRTSFFTDQLRFAAPERISSAGAPASGCGCADSAAPAKVPFSLAAFSKRLKLDKLFEAMFDIGIKKILPLFTAFAAIGYLINRFIPAEWISAVFGANNAFSVVIAAIVGLPLYVSGSAAIPLMHALLQAGVSPGAMLAFMITGPGTSAGVLAGIATILKRRALGFYVLNLLLGAIVLGYLYNAIFPLL